MRPGGRLILLTWQLPERNEWHSAFRTALAAGRELPKPQSGAPGPISLSDPDRVRRLLSSAGFVDVRLQGLSMADHQTDRGVLYDSATWLIEARRS